MNVIQYSLANLLDDISKLYQFIEKYDVSLRGLFSFSPSIVNACCRKRRGELAFLPLFLGANLHLSEVGPFFDRCLLLWQEFAHLDIRNAPCSTGCSSITLTSSFKNTSPVSKRSTVSSDPSSKKSWSAIWTAATLAAALPASAVPRVGKRGY